MECGALLAQASGQMGIQAPVYNALQSKGAILNKQGCYFFLHKIKALCNMYFFLTFIWFTFGYFLAYLTFINVISSDLAVLFIAFNVHQEDCGKRHKDMVCRRCSAAHNNSH